MIPENIPENIQDALNYANDIIATLRESFLVLNSDLRVKTANRAFYTSFKVTKEQTEGFMICELWGDDVPLQLRALLRSVLTDHKPVQDYEVEHDFPGLGRKSLFFNASQFPPDAANPEFILLAIEDVTEKKRSATIIKESEIRYRRLFQAAKDGILILDADTGKIIDANPFMTTLLGYSHEEFLSKELWEIGLFKDKEASQIAYRELHANGYIRYEHLPLETQNGKRVEVEFISNLYQMSGSNVAQCNIRDITERIRLEKETKTQSEILVQVNTQLVQFHTKSMESWTQLAELMPQIVWTCTADGETDYLNRQWVIYSGVSVQSACQHGWLNFVHPDDRATCIKIWDEAIHTNSGFELQYRIINAEGKYRWFLARCNPIFESEKIIRWVGTCTDINDSKIKEESMRGDATRKDEFLAMLAHELRNPLSVIVNGVQVLDTFAKQRGTPNEDVTTCAMILRQTKHLTRLVDDLLDVSRITRGKILLHRQVMDIAVAIMNGVEMSRMSISDKQQHFKLNFEPQAVKVKGDSIRLSQVFSNLLSNASKYTQSGGSIELTVSHDKGNAIVKIKDNGLGIAPDNINYIFDLFSQADHSLDRAQGGLGIGLTLCKSIMLMHDGDVIAHSEGLGKGSEFTITLPMTDEDIVKEVRINGHTRKHTILVVDDVIDAVTSMAQLLKIQGHKVFTATTGKAALRFVEEVKPTVVLLDIGLPEMNGYQVAEKIRQMVGHSVLIVALTGYGSEDDQRRSAEAGFDYHLTKPVEPIDLAEILR